TGQMNSNCPANPAMARPGERSRLRLSSKYPECRHLNPGTSRVFSHFAGVHKTQSSQIWGPYNVTNPATAGIGKACPTCAAIVIRWLTTGGGALAQPARSSQPSPVGEWLVADRVARIKIVDCNGHLWGVVAWEARAGTDTKNPDPKLRNRPTLGMPIL